MGAVNLLISPWAHIEPVGDSWRFYIDVAYDWRFYHTRNMIQFRFSFRYKVDLSLETRRPFAA